MPNALVCAHNGNRDRMAIGTPITGLPVLRPGPSPPRSGSGPSEAAVASVAIDSTGDSSSRQLREIRRYSGHVDRAITAFHRDEEGDWVADLSCGHCQHVRHLPPFQLRAWVLEAEGRRSRLGSPLGCPLCDRAELPDSLRLVRSTPRWNEHTMPLSLSRAHRVAKGTWGRIVVHDGKLRFLARTQPELRVVVGPGSTQAIPPEVEHMVQPIGSVSFSIDFLSVGESKAAMVSDGGHSGDDSAATGWHLPDEGGDPVCWAHLLCPDCGAVLDDGLHRNGCGSSAKP